MNKREVIMANTGQTLTDRINAARYALAGQGLARCVCKATTEEIIGPKKKHIDYLIACTNEPNVSIPQLANLLIERANHTSWVVVLKSLTTVHHLMSNGNEKFTQYMASSNYTFDLSGFLDRTMARGYNMSQFVRKYSLYINAKSLAYRMLALDLCKVGKDVKSPNPLRVMNMENLSKTLPVLESQLDALLNFECTAKDLNNNVINAAFIQSFRDLVKLFVSYNDCIINLLERYFKLSRKKTKEALGLYKNFLERMDRVKEFLSVAEAIGVDKDEIPDLKTAPSSILDALESHLNNLQAKKGGKKAAAHSPMSETEETKDLDGNKVHDHEKENYDLNPSDNSNPTSNPFLSKPCNDDATSDQNLEGKQNKDDEKISHVVEAPINNLAVNEVTKNDNSSSSTNEHHNSNEIHQAPPRPASSPAASPKSKATSNDLAAKEIKSIPKSETTSKPPSRPPSRPPPPSSASSSRAVSPTITVDVVADIANRENTRDGDDQQIHHEETASSSQLETTETEAILTVSNGNEVNQTITDGIKSQQTKESEVTSSTADSTTTSQSRRSSTISRSGHAAPPARPAPPASAKIEPPPKEE